MLPHLTVWGLRLPTHELFTVLGFLAAGVVLAIAARRDRRWNGDLGWIVAGLLVGAAIFTKAGSVWRYMAEAEEPSLWGVWLHGGKTLLGGLAGAYVGVEVTKRIIRYRGSTGDLFAPAVALGLAVGRVGCLLTEQVGTPSSLPWAVTLSPEVAARVPNCPQCLTGEALHPSFAYEILFLLAMFLILLWIRPRLSVEGDSFKVFLVAYAVFRFLVEFTRGNREFIWGLSGSQVFLLLTSPLILALAIRRFSGARRARGSPAAEPAVPA